MKSRFAVEARDLWCEPEARALNRERAADELVKFANWGQEVTERRTGNNSD